MWNYKVILYSATKSGVVEGTVCSSLCMETSCLRTKPTSIPDICTRCLANFFFLSERILENILELRHAVQIEYMHNAVFIKMATQFVQLKGTVSHDFRP